MNAYPMLRDPPTRRCVAGTFAALVAGLLLGGNVLAATIAVTSTADEFGTGAGCGLREAVQAANTNAAFGGCSAGSASGIDQINVPTGFYTLSRIGIDEDNNATSDIDINSLVNIQGAGSGILSIGDTSHAYRGRIFHVVSGGAVISGVTLRDGELVSGRFGGGLRANPGTAVILNDVRVFGNTADGGGGGILNGGEMTLNNSLVDNNNTTNAFEGGGGIYNQGLLTLNDSRVLSNRTEGNGANGNGAGIYNEADRTLFLDNTTVDGNVIAIGGIVGGDVAGNGGGIFSAGPLTIVQSTISNNVAAGNNAHGGGIYCEASGAASNIVDLSLIFANRADGNPDVSTDNPGGGGIATENCNLSLRNTVISANSAASFDLGNGGGLFSDSATISILNSLVVGNNTAGQGGGIFATTNNFFMENSTILNNTAESRGGGVLLGPPSSGIATVITIASSTIVGNTSNTDGISGGDGGGLLTSGAIVVTMKNSVIAGNLASGTAVGDDCSGSLTSTGHNHIQSAAGCTLSGGGGTDTLNVNAGLATATNNGGPLVGASNGTTAGMLTRAPLAGSPLVDAGNPTGCRNGNGSQILATDQLGETRAQDGPDANLIATCDIGAVEFPTDPDRIFAHGFE